MKRARRATPACPNRHNFIARWMQYDDGDDDERDDDDTCCRVYTVIRTARELLWAHSSESDRARASNSCAFRRRGTTRKPGEGRTTPKQTFLAIKARESGQRRGGEISLKKKTQSRAPRLRNKRPRMEERQQTGESTTRTLPFNDCMYTVYARACLTHHSRRRRRRPRKQLSQSARWTNIARSVDS